MTSSPSNILKFPSQAEPVRLIGKAAGGTICRAALDKLTAEERADYVASIVRPAIGFGQRKGRKLESLPPQLRAWLLELCALGDPTCLVIRDWLGGNPAFTAAREDT
ncbi:hypothetical protein N5C66_18255 [Rhizobium pusense]|uniref:hypothetical protein n=1 Tax=Agrobacterium pusense TaxID=648995 RepID=UPI000D1B0CCF|nr:hypothetical protein [Agrobacterium pusense]MDH0911162.1 hypothetical protein [Agrobacterium pusense]MDH1097231.1 hypothetical protein [Agrobacterium pusense]MDH1113685.1 hypothetical protein [Agrobacterium pusense]MDH2193207.1 hypothetical protein [Agrobacterium pusense]